MSHWIIHLEGGPRRVNHAGVLIKNYIYSFGGYCTGGNFEEVRPMDIHALNIHTYAWTLLLTDNEDDVSIYDQVPYHRYGHTAVNWRDSAYIFGGRNDCNGACNKLYCFDPESNRWSRINAKGPIPGARDGHSACVVDNKMYMFGGYEEELQRFSDDMFVFNFLSSEWTLLLTTGTPAAWRDFHSSTPIRHLIFIFGGRSDEAGQFHTNSEVYCNKLVIFNTKNNSWSRPQVKGCEPFGRRSHAAFEYKDELYIIGGYNSIYDIHFADIFKYNFDENKWACVRVNGEGPGVRRRHCCCIAGDRMFLFGGTRPSSVMPPSYIVRNEEHLVDLSDLHVLHFSLL